jgi:hypothetical protein
MSNTLCVLWVSVVVFSRPQGDAHTTSFLVLGHVSSHVLIYVRWSTGVFSQKPKLTNLKASEAHTYETHAYEMHAYEITPVRGARPRDACR